jgi:phospholipid transport system substrate-binding protein
MQVDAIGLDAIGAVGCPVMDHVMVRNAVVGAGGLLSGRAAVAGLRRVVPLVCACVVLVAGLLMAPVVGAVEASRTDALKRSVAQVVEVLKDPQLASPAQKEERRKKLRQIIYAQFDFATMSQGSVGPKWNSFTPAQQERFIGLFQKLLEESYLDKVEGYQGDGVRFVKEVEDGPQLMRVDSVIHHKGQEYHLAYRLSNRNPANAGAWKVFDVMIEGISLVSNYRAQFQQILGNAGVEGLLEKLGNKVRQNATGGSAL